MDKIEKLLRKLRAKEAEALLLIMLQLKKDFRKVPNLIPLAGKKNWYRVRMGNYRIIFTAHNQKIEIVRVTKRDDRTYTGL